MVFYDDGPFRAWSYLHSLNARHKVLALLRLATENVKVVLEHDRGMIASREVHVKQFVPFVVLRVVDACFLASSAFTSR